MSKGGRTRHLIFLAHIWVCLPFAVLWMMHPEVTDEVPFAQVQGLRIFATVVIAYVSLRTFLAWRNPKWLNWELVYPPIDVIVVSVLLNLGDRKPLSNLALLYFLPIAEAAGTLNVRWAASVSVMSIIGTLAASVGHNERPFNVAFRFFFLILMSSLLTFLARQAAELRARLQVAADRNRIALEMHDGVQAHLATVASQLELAQHIAPKDGERAAQIAADSRGMVRETIDEIRYLVQRMRSSDLEKGFVPALRQYAHNLCERNGIALTFDLTGTPKTLPAEAENALFRIAQESLSNVLRHAQATAVQVELAFTDSSVRLCVRDNGVGVSRTDDGGFHTGLEGMLERAAENGGTLTVTPAEGGGTQVEAVLPTQPQAQPASWLLAQDQASAN
jgi:two-component system, NarL family, sensor histidine kinase DegS